MTLAIAEPVRAFLRGDQLQRLLDLHNVSAKDIPRYGLQVQLPVGTRVRTRSTVISLKTQMEIWTERGFINYGHNGKNFPSFDTWKKLR